MIFLPRILISCYYVLKYGFERLQWQSASFHSLKVICLLLWSPNCIPCHPRAPYTFTEVLEEVKFSKEMGNTEHLLNTSVTQGYSVSGLFMRSGSIPFNDGISLQSHVFCSNCDKQIPKEICGTGNEEGGNVQSDSKVWVVVLYPSGTRIPLVTAWFKNAIKTYFSFNLWVSYSFKWLLKRC